MHHLTGLLPDAPERQERAEWANSGLLLELPAGGRQQLLAGVHHALWDGPRAGVAVAPEGTAGMGQEDL